tara:strand:+ start:907 stop:2319 length:1413 start_codon:yes stop_codon:yes gene_type:complete
MKLLNIELNKDIISLGVGNLFRFILLVIYSRLQTYFLSYEELSKFYLVFSLYTFFSFVIIGPIGIYVTRNIIEWYQSNQLISGLKSIYIKLILPISVLAFISIVTAGYFLNYDVNLLIIGGIISLIIITKTANELIYPFFNLIDRNTIYLILIILFHLLNPLFSFLAIKLYEPTHTFWLLGLIFSNLFVAIIGWRILKKVSKEDKIINLDFKTLKTFSLYIMLGNILGWILTDGFRFVAENEIGLSAVGILILGLMGASQIFANIENFFNQLLSPKYLQNISNATYASRAKAFNELFTVAIPLYLSLAFLVTLIAEIIISVIIDKSKINEILITAFVIGIWIECFKALINIVKNISTSEYKTQAMIIPYLSGALVLIIGFALGYFYDVTSISKLILLSYVSIFIFSLIFLNTIIKIKLDILFIVKRMIPILILTFVFNMFSDGLYRIISLPLYGIAIYSIINYYLKKQAR